MPALEAITGEHFGGGGFAPHQWAQTVLIIPEVPSAAKLEPITKQLRYSQKEADGWREKGKKMTITAQQQTELHSGPQQEAAVLNLAIWR